MYKFRASVYRKASLLVLFASLWGGFLLDLAGNWWVMYLFGSISIASVVFYIYFWNKEVDGIKEWYKKRTQRQKERIRREKADEEIRRRAKLEEEGRMQARKRRYR